MNLSVASSVFLSSLNSCETSSVFLVFSWIYVWRHLYLYSLEFMCDVICICIFLNLCVTSLVYLSNDVTCVSITLTWNVTSSVFFLLWTSDCRSSSRWLITRCTAAPANSCQPQTMSRRGVSAASEASPSSTPPSNGNPDYSTDKDLHNPSRWGLRRLTRYESQSYKNNLVSKRLVISAFTIVTGL